MLRRTLVLVLTSAAYGYALGTAHSQIYATRNLVKFPLLILTTAAVCLLAYGVLARFLGLRLGLRPVLGLALDTFRDLSVLLASLTPPALFLALVLRHTDDQRLGEYSLFLGLNGLFVAVAGGLALMVRGRSLLRAGTTRGPRAALLLAGWLALTLAVGGQVAFYLRPFFGLPASRGNVPPFALGSTPDVRGATNFYEAMMQVFSEPPLPKSW